MPVVVAQPGAHGAGGAQNDRGAQLQFRHPILMVQKILKIVEIPHVPCTDQGCGRASRPGCAGSTGAGRGENHRDPTIADCRENRRDPEIQIVQDTQASERLRIAPVRQVAPAEIVEVVELGPVESAPLMFVTAPWSKRHVQLLPWSSTFLQHAAPAPVVETSLQHSLWSARHQRQQRHTWNSFFPADGHGSDCFCSSVAHDVRCAAHNLRDSSFPSSEETTICFVISTDGAIISAFCLNTLLKVHRSDTKNVFQLANFFV